MSVRWWSLRSVKRAGRRGVREDHCLCMVSFLWDESLLMPFPAALGLSGLLSSISLASCIFSERRCFASSFLPSPCLQIQITLLQGFSDIWLEINLSGDLFLYVSCLPPFYVLYLLPCKHMFLFTIGLTEITTATIFTAFMLGS